MKEQIHIFFTALMFYTRIPCPPWVDHRSDYLNRATVYFPLIGWIVGGGSFLVFWLAAFLLNPLLALILSLASSVLITGAFHEDGFADTCDGFGGGWTQAQILKIMKDSRLGTYAAVGLILLFALKIAALYELSQKFSILDLGVIFILAHSSSRWMATTLIYTLDYARDPEDSKAKPVAQKMSLSLFLRTSLMAALPWILAYGFFPKAAYGLALVPMALITWYLGHYFRRRMGGYTGDCLGAIQQISEVIFYLSYMAIWKFI